MDHGDCMQLRLRNCHEYSLANVIVLSWLPSSHGNGHKSEYRTAYMHASDSVCAGIPAGRQIRILYIVFGSCQPASCTRSITFVARLRIRDTRWHPPPVTPSTETCLLYLAWSQPNQQHQQQHHQHAAPKRKAFTLFVLFLFSLLFSCLRNNRKHIPIPIHNILMNETRGPNTVQTRSHSNTHTRLINIFGWLLGFLNPLSLSYIYSMFVVLCLLVVTDARWGAPCHRSHST